MQVSAGLKQLIGSNVHTKFSGELGTKRSVQANDRKHHDPNTEIQPLHLTTNVTPPKEALEATPNRHADNHRQHQHAANAVPKHGGHATETKRALPQVGARP